MTAQPLDDADDRQHSGIQVIARSAKIMRTLSANAHSSGMSLGAIASAVDLPRSTVQRIITALVAEHLVEPAGTSGFRIGPAVGQMLYTTNPDVVALLKPHVELLSSKLQETVCLAQLKQQKLHIVEAVVGEQALRVVPQIGIAPPLQITAVGKVLLARMEDASIVEWLRREPQPACSTAEQLLSEIAQVRHCGYAQDMDNIVLGVSAIATAITTYRGPYALMLLVPTARMQAHNACYLQNLLSSRDAMEKLLDSPLR